MCVLCLFFFLLFAYLLICLFAFSLCLLTCVCLLGCFAVLLFCCFVYSCLFIPTPLFALFLEGIFVCVGIVFILLLFVSFFFCVCMISFVHLLICQAAVAGGEVSVIDYVLKVRYLNISLPT